MAAAPCKDCGRRPKVAGRHRCAVCALRVAPIGEQVAAARARAAMVPDELRLARVPARLWPEGQRWCAPCQSFRDFDDFADGASRCRPCASSATHGAMIAKTYGLSPAEYDRLLALQGGRCAICRGRPKSKRLAVDHDHGSGAVRGLLCSRCNSEALGSLHDSVELAWNAFAYLATPPAGLLSGALDVASWDDVLTTSRQRAGRAPLGDEQPRRASSVDPGFVSASAGRTAPRSGQGGPALAAALERANEPREPWPPVKAALDELDAALASGKLDRVRAAVDAVRARGLLVPTAF